MVEDSIDGRCARVPPEFAKYLPKEESPPLHMRFQYSLKTALSLVFLALSSAGCGPEDKALDDEMVWPEALCPEGLLVEGVAGRLLLGRTTAGQNEAKISLFMEDASKSAREEIPSGSEARENDAVFRFRNIPDGKHRLRGCYKGYSGDAEVDVVEGKSTFVCLWLLPVSC